VLNFQCELLSLATVAPDLANNHNLIKTKAFIKTTLLLTKKPLKSLKYSHFLVKHLENMKQKSSFFKVRKRTEP